LDWPVVAGVLCSFRAFGAGDVKAFFGFLLRDFCFDAASGALEFALF
jgi:hypothetical protein